MTHTYIKSISVLSAAIVFAIVLLAGAHKSEAAPAPVCLQVFTCGTDGITHSSSCMPAGVSIAHYGACEMEDDIETPTYHSWQSYRYESPVLIYSNW